jgi:hypothetical protein
MRTHNHEHGAALRPHFCNSLKLIPAHSEMRQLSNSARIAAAIIATVNLLACSSSSSSPINAASCSNPGGAVAGPADSHCGSTVLIVEPNICATTVTPQPSDDAGAGTTEYGDTLFNSEGEDDDCKYHVSWTSTAICENANVTFSLKVTAKASGSPVTGATPDLEVFLTDTHPGLVSNQASKETSAGNYTIGPVKFDAKGQWTIRFHLFPTGCDQPTSPHGHAGFYVSVP